MCASRAVPTHCIQRRSAIQVSEGSRRYYVACSFKQVLRHQFSAVTLHSLIHPVFYLTTGPKPPPKRCLHIVRSKASSSRWEYPLLSLRSSSSFLRLLPRLLATYISPFIFPSITSRNTLHTILCWKGSSFVSGSGTFSPCSNYGLLAWR